MKAVSMCPNGYIAKKLLKELPDIEWIPRHFVRGGDHR
jgi:hypothetical protein